jgi:hypothetical protein
LKRELIANADLPSHTNFPITDSELEDYRAGHATKASNRLYTPKPREDY